MQARWGITMKGLNAFQSVCHSQFAALCLFLSLLCGLVKAKVPLAFYDGKTIDVQDMIYGEGCLHRYIKFDLKHYQKEM